ncbi:MAG TPA: cbb3-type cytochrome c oxidase subunit II [Opitutaceae bacterium]|nr:cbb3-type cytochrome c oxidase subunit II [Opitutaceae bacterium]
MRKTDASSESGRGAVPIAAAVVSLWACYVYFLLFGEFALVELVRAQFSSSTSVRGVLALLAGGGIVGSLASARAFHPSRLSRHVVIGFSGAVTGAVASLVSGLASLMAAVVVTGLALGWLTVSLVAGLREVLGVRRLGWWVGVGTGLAYACCNVPPVFNAAPRVQAVVAAGVALVGALAGARLRPGGAAEAEPTEAQPAIAAAWTLALLALVWLDSGAFYAIQHSVPLKGVTWAGAAVLWGNAVMHFLAALVSGLLLDRRRAALVLAGAVVALVAACAALRESLPGARWAYTAGVSLYSVALVWYPMRTGRPAIGAIIFIVAGWVGSGLGIGMVQNLSEVPRWFLAAAFGAVAVALAWRRHGLRRAGAGLAIVAAVLGSARATRAAAADAVLIARGRQVYISEGCIHCHSQYVRPNVPDDVLRWGPPQTLASIEAEVPPLPGNRRQGPDLSEVGARRTPDWQRVHLIAPRTVSGGSRMPSFSYLFGPGDGRGPALIAYLQSLGGNRAAEHYAATTKWRPSAGASGNRARGERLFARLCVGCHGPAGKGDGVLASELTLAPVDLTGGWPQVDSADPLAVARLIKFGLPGTAMAGREYLGDSDVLSLVAFARAMQHKPASGPRMAGKR